jgi:hypothetical protein
MFSGNSRIDCSSESIAQGPVKGALKRLETDAA